MKEEELLDISIDQMEKNFDFTTRRTAPTKIMMGNKVDESNLQLSSSKQEDKGDLSFLGYIQE